VALKHFTPDKWHLRPYGSYVGPISIFHGRYQPKLRELFIKGRAQPIDFGVGYRWRLRDSNLLLATKGDGKTVAGR
jgi:hypothetical protein